VKRTLAPLAVIALLCLSLLLSPPVRSVPRPVSQPLVQRGQDAVFSLRGALLGSEIFTNFVDGYSMKIPAGMTADMGDSAVRAVLESKDLRIEIYKQSFGEPQGFTKEEYLSYSNSGITREAGYEIRSEENLIWLDKSAEVTLWSRPPLLHMENDRRHYAAVDFTFPEDAAVFTVLLKSAKPLTDAKGSIDAWMRWAGDIRLVDGAAPPDAAPRGDQALAPGRDGETELFYETCFLSGGPPLWGLFQPEAPLDFEALYALEADLGYRFPLLLYYTGIIEGADAHPRLAQALRAAGAADRILELTLQTYSPEDGAGNIVYDVLNGKYDAFLRHYAETVAAARHPVLFRPGNEMNGDWCAYSALYTARDAEVYKAFYRYIYEIFREAGADNVLWIWNPNSRSFPDFKWNDALCYYPGDEYVDIVGMTAYNTGTYYESERWESFGSLYGQLYENYAATFRQPLMITEFASSSVGGDKAAWARDMFKTINGFERIRAAVWWNSRDLDADGNVARPYCLNETEEVTEVFRDNLGAGAAY
jgi:hypothetical protein